MVSTLYMCLLCATPCSRVMESCRHADALDVQLSVLAHVNEATNKSSILLQLPFRLQRSTLTPVRLSVQLSAARVCWLWLAASRAATPSVP